MTDYEMLVNRGHKLSPLYKPEGLIEVPRDQFNIVVPHKLSAVVYDNFLQLQEIAQKEGIQLRINSAYRSYGEQSLIWAKTLARRGLEYTQKHVAPPGASEHQTGLAADFTKVVNGINDNLTPEESNWLAEKGAPHGFILRYPKEKESITGFDYEAWHFRYVNPDLAQFLYENSLTLEEYKEQKGMMR